MEPLTDLNDMRRFSNALRLNSQKRIGDLTDQLVDGGITLDEWHEQMKAELRRANLEQFVTGHGGTREGVKRTDYLRLGPELKRQYRHLRQFAIVIEQAAAQDKPLTFARARANLYARSTQAMFWREAIPVKLPQVPRDGKTRCRTNCRCHLRRQFERDGNGAVTAVLVWWTLTPAEHCPDCLALAREWSPLRIETDDVQESDIGQGIALLALDLKLDPLAVGLLREAWGLTEEVA